MKYVAYVWAFIVLIGCLILLWNVLFNGGYSEINDLLVMTAFVMIIFMISFMNTFKEPYALWPQIAKMLWSVVSVILLFAIFYKSAGVVSSQGVVSKDPVDALCFSVVTWITLGYGDFHPVDRARIVASIQALLGILFTPIFVSVVFYQLSKRDGKEDALRCIK